MKKFLMILLISVVVPFFVAAGAMAIPFGDGGASLQGVLDTITVTPHGDSSIDVTTDYIPDAYDSYWMLTGTGISAATMIIELAGYADSNSMGVYSDGVYVELFSGSQGAGDQAVLSIKSDGSVYVNLVDTGVDFAGNSFGYYLDSPDGIFHSDTSLNADQLDHMAAYQGLNTDWIQLPGLAPGLWTDNEFVLAFEDLYGGGDMDFDDFVVMVESVSNPVPEPATMILLGSGLIGMAVVGRKKFLLKARSKS